MSDSDCGGQAGRSRLRRGPRQKDTCEEPCHPRPAAAIVLAIKGSSPLPAGWRAAASNSARSSTSPPNMPTEPSSTRMRCVCFESSDANCPGGIAAAAAGSEVILTGAGAVYPVCFASCLFGTMSWPDSRIEPHVAIPMSGVLLPERYRASPVTSQGGLTRKTDIFRRGSCPTRNCGFDKAYRHIS